MVARVNTSNSIAKALNYNEQKLKEGKAEILSASGFIKEADQLNFYDKVNRFEQVTSLNERTTTNSVHISLNFDPSEKISNEKMIEIADAYMQKTGFGDQPYLVYRHHDSGHPHIHIVTTNIQRDGKRISMHNFGRNQSEKARKEIEKEFNLVKAESKHNEELKVIPVNAQKVKYGKSETKRAIQNVLAVVLNQYRFSSLPELNAVLKEYNIVAETGGVNSKMYKGKGLTYRVLDENGNKIGAPIKASAFYMKPTLKWLEKKFEENLALKAPYKKKIQTSIDWVLAKNPRNLDEFIDLLRKEHINVVVHKGKGDVIYGLTYIDHRSKVVFNGSDIGKAYSAKAVLEKFQQSHAKKEQQQEIKVEQRPKQPDGKIEMEKTLPVKVSNNAIVKQESISDKINITMSGEKPPIDYVPKELKRKKRRKRKRISI